MNPNHTRTQEQKPIYHKNKKNANYRTISSFFFFKLNNFLKRPIGI